MDANKAKTTHRHIHWQNAGKPCEASIIRDMGDGSVIVRFTTLPPRVIMPYTMCLPWNTLVSL